MYRYDVTCMYLYDVIAKVSGYLGALINLQEKQDAMS